MSVAQQPYPDTGLHQRLVYGDETALAEVYDTYGALVHRIAGRVTRSPAAAEGTPGNRIRFAVETARAVSAEIGAARTGLRLSPGNPFNDISEPADELEATYTSLVKELSALDLAYLHVMEVGPIRDLVTTLRGSFNGPFILNPATEGPTGADALTLVEDGTADVIAFGALFLANPDLPARLKAEGPYNTPDPSTFFGGTEKGYTDSPAL